MNSSLEAPDLDFLKAIQRLQPATVQSLCQEFSVTATAVRQRLARLESRGFVARETNRQGRGRPNHEYTITPAGLRQLGDDHAELALLLWRELLAIPDPVIREKVLKGIRQALVSRLGSRISSSSVGTRLEELSAALVDRGFVVEVDPAQTDLGQLPILREHSCPYHELAALDSGICDLEQSVFAELLGAPVVLSACRRDGHRCCEFQVGKPEKTDLRMVVRDAALPV